MVEDARARYDQERNQDERIINQPSYEVGCAGNEVDIEVFPQQIIGWNFALSRHYRTFTAAPPSAKIGKGACRPGGYVLHEIMYEPATQQRHVGYIKGDAHRTEDGQSKKNDIPISCKVATRRHTRRAKQEQKASRRPYVTNNQRSDSQPACSLCSTLAIIRPQSRRIDCVIFVAFPMTHGHQSDHAAPPVFLRQFRRSRSQFLQRLTVFGQSKITFDLPLASV